MKLTHSALWLSECNAKSGVPLCWSGSRHPLMKTLSSEVP